MLRVPCKERTDWRAKADEYGFKFHTLYGEPYWDESAYYQFNLEQIERDLEAPTAELHQMCLAVVDKVVNDERLMALCQIPEFYWDQVRASWLRRDPTLYSRLDLAYNGQGPAKLLENNADTPTSLYETGFWQWLWLEEQVDRGMIGRSADQFNSLQEQLIYRFKELNQFYQHDTLYLSCCQDSEEDRGTTQYLQDCAEEAGINTKFVYIEDIGLGEEGRFTDLDNQEITWLFKLYPWEFMFRERYGADINSSGTSWLEPMWKAIVSNKAILPLLWEFFPNHPNLLPAFFSHDKRRSTLTNYVKKPIFAREGANITLVKQGKTVYKSKGPYGEEGYIYQGYTPLPCFAENHTLVGSWLVGDQPAGISIREDKSPITQDLSRYLPHIIG